MHGNGDRSAGIAGMGLLPEDSVSTVTGDASLLHEAVGSCWADGLHDEVWIAGQQWTCGQPLHGCISMQPDRRKDRCGIQCASSGKQLPVVGIVLRMHWHCHACRTCK